LMMMSLIEGMIMVPFGASIALGAVRKRKMPGSRGGPRKRGKARRYEDEERFLGYAGRRARKRCERKNRSAPLGMTDLFLWAVTARLKSCPPRKGRSSAAPLRTAANDGHDISCPYGKRRTTNRKNGVEQEGQNHGTEVPPLHWKQEQRRKAAATSQGAAPLRSG
jgi:hypothetical protein